ncbi:hypothetical protein QF028_004403 [Neobacillus sp. B4I6]
MFTGVWLMMVAVFITGVVYGDVTAKGGGK